jgi:hypothetical protein
MSVELEGPKLFANWPGQPDRGKIFADFTRQGNSFEAHFDYRKRLTIDCKAWYTRGARDVG